MKILKIIGYAFLGLFVLWAIIAILPLPQQVEGENLFRANDGEPLIIAHRGSYHLFPESTMEAYCHAYTIDPNVVFEADLILTQDRVLVISHDRTFDRNSDLPPGQEGHLVNYQDLIDNRVNFAYNNRLDRSDGFRVGELVPYTNYRGETVTPSEANCPAHITSRDDEVFLITSLEELIRAFPNQRYILEIKQSGDLGIEALDTFIALMDALNDEVDGDLFTRVSVGTFHRDIYDRFVEIHETTHPQFLFSPQNDVVLNYFILHHLRLTQFFRAPISSLQVPRVGEGFNLATRHFIRTAQRHNIAVHYWTINDPDVLRELIELGADGIITDRVDVMRQVLDDMQD